MRDAGRIVLAADTIGAAWRMIDDAVAYAGQRRQFGRLIGTFQAVKHLCADMAAELEPGRSLIWYAAYAQDQHRDDAALVTAHAKAYLSEAGRMVARKATEVHGGIGITDDLGLHFWFKRIGWNYQMLGAPERLREESRFPASSRSWSSGHHPPTVPESRNAAISPAENPQSCNASSVFSPGCGGLRRMDDGVRLKRGAGHGCTTPSTVTWLCRARICG